MSSSTDTPRGATWLLMRVLGIPLLLLLLVGAYLFTARALAVREAGLGIVETARPAVQQPWKDAYARRFPGCVPAVLWPGRETPVAVIVTWDGGGVERVDRGQPLRRALAVNGAHAARVIGACYR